MSVTSDEQVARQRSLVPALAVLLQLVPLVIAFIGMGISAYLSYVHFSGVPVYCQGSGGCHTVQASEYATLLTVPVALIGFILYACIFAAGLVTLRGTGWPAQVTPFLVFGMALTGVMYSAYLTWLELYRIYAICSWCVTSACLLTVLFAAATAEILVSGRLRDPDAPVD
jgi:uncharacterized membrane protein